MGRLTKTTQADGSQWRTTYDALGHPIESRSPLGLTATQRTFDAALGNALSVTDASGNTTTYAYDLATVRR